jgi:energy-converting hydrogenase Eha subunit H
MLLITFADMLTDMTTYEIIILAAALVGVYIKQKMDLNELKGEINELFIKQKNHETQTSEIKAELAKVLEAVNEIKLLIARNQLDK